MRTDAGAVGGDHDLAGLAGVADEPGRVHGAGGTAHGARPTRAGVEDKQGVAHRADHVATAAIRTRLTVERASCNGHNTLFMNRS